MRRFGGMHPSGLQSYNIVEQIMNSYLAGLGSAFDTRDGVVRVRALAYARALACIWADVERAKTAMLPESTFALEAWEKAFGIVPNPTLSEHQRRITLALAWAKIGCSANIGTILSKMNEIFGAELFLGYRVTTPNESASDGTASIPGGGGASGGTVYDDGPWRSCAAHIAIELDYVAASFVGYEGQVQALVDQAYSFLNDVLPAWVQFTFIRSDFVTDNYPNIDNGTLG